MKGEIVKKPDEKVQCWYIFCLKSRKLKFPGISLSSKYLKEVSSSYLRELIWLQSKI